jgi:shikimate kinase
MKIYLVGMPGCGKSTIGIQLSDALQIDFFDLDSEIEKRERKTISEIFRDQGEDYFRMTEAKVLRDFASLDQSFVLATGGGTPCFYNGMEILNETGISVFLDVDVAELVRRLSKKTDRPLLLHEDLEKKLGELLNNRLPVYSRASIVLKNPTINVLLEKFRK